ncbi:MAG: ABC transporter permease [Lachnospiraceae bacterium]|nr:ABC transporter permease [Lachnospiraceae bacterium]
MPRISTVVYSIGQGGKNLRRNRMFSLASIGTMAACLFLFGIFYFLLQNLQYAIKGAETNVGVTVFFEKGTSVARVEQIQEEIGRRTEVAYVNYVSAEEAWERYKQTSLTAEQIESFGEDNPLENSASLEVHINDVSAQTDLIRYIETFQEVRQINDSQELADMLNGINRAVSIVKTVIIAILAGVAVFLISTTISTGISIRAQEISIMKLIGATDFFIEAPFFVEGVLLGAIGAAIPLALLYAVYREISNYIAQKLVSVLGRGTMLLDSGAVFRMLVPIALAIGIGIGVLGTWMTLKKQLRKIL